MRRVARNCNHVNRDTRYEETEDVARKNKFNFVLKHTIFRSENQKLTMMKQVLFVAALVASASAFAPSTRCVAFVVVSRRMML